MFSQKLAAYLQNIYFEERIWFTASEIGIFKKDVLVNLLKNS